MQLCRVVQPSAGIDIDKEHCQWNRAVTEPSLFALTLLQGHISLSALAIQPILLLRPQHSRKSW
jgi:hypothetical protein